MTKKVLIVGGTGMLGHKLVHCLGNDERLEVHCTVRQMPRHDFASSRTTYHTDVLIAHGETRLRDVIQAVQPDIIINAVGAIKQHDLYSAVDDTYYINAVLPHLLALWTQGTSTYVVQFSTDCVFRGDRGGYSEADQPDVEDLYGRSKACGELDYGRHLTLRTSIIGFEPSNQLGLLSWLLRHPRGSEVRGYSEAIYSGLPTTTVGRTLIELVNSTTLSLSGIYHVASEQISKFELLKRVNEALSLGHHILPDLSVKIDRSLSDTRFRAATGTSRPDWGTLVAELVNDFQSLPYASVYPSFKS
jgi:dTDP-4-dehydrorhamnose reductase